MNLASLLETWGDANVLTAGGAIIGLVFGFAAQRTRLCAREAVLECCQGQAGERLSVWLLAFGAWLLAVQAVVAMGWLQPLISRFSPQPGSIPGLWWLVLMGRRDFDARLHQLIVCAVGQWQLARPAAHPCGHRR